MLTPKRLQKGQMIGLFSPSEPLTPRRLPRLNNGIALLERNGFRTILAPNALQSRHYTAGTIQMRVSDINGLVMDDRVSALMATWGGKSTNQLLPYLDYIAIQNQRKPILAFSDGCVLANAIMRRTGLVTFYGPNVAGKLDETRHGELGILCSERSSEFNILGNSGAVDARALRSGIAEGKLFGGNLSTFVLGLVGSQYMPDPAGGIFFWESGGESPQIVDQFLSCARNASLFENLAGMVIGDFIRDEFDEYKRRDPFEMVLEAVSGYNFPVAYCPTFGHPKDLENPVIPIGVKARLDTSAMTLTMLEPCVG